MFPGHVEEWEGCRRSWSWGWDAASGSDAPLTGENEGHLKLGVSSYEGFL